MDISLFISLYEQKFLASMNNTIQWNLSNNQNAKGKVIDVKTY
jgi:hypothetical protein